MHKLCLFLRITQIVLFSKHIYFKKETVLCLFQTFFKRITAKSLDKLIPIFMESVRTNEWHILPPCIPVPPATAH